MGPPPEKRFDLELRGVQGADGVDLRDVVKAYVTKSPPMEELIVDKNKMSFEMPKFKGPFDIKGFKIHTKEINLHLNKHFNYSVASLFTQR